MIREGTKIVKAIQVTYSTGANMDREIDGLLEALKTHKLSEGLILTMDDEKIIEKDNKKIIIKPAWKWMLEG